MRQWIHFAVLPFAGLDREALASSTGIARTLVASIAAGSALAYAYGLNACADRGSDASREKNPLIGLEETPGSVRATILAAAVATLAIAAVLGRDAMKLAVASLIAGTIYSVGPRFKAFPVLGLLFNTAIFAPLLGLAVRDHQAPAATLTITVVFVGLLFQNQLLHELADVDEDARGGARTTAWALGARGTRLAIVLLALPVAALAVRMAPNVAVAASAVLAVAAGTVASLLERDAARARRLHRRVSIVVGALLFLSSLTGLLA